MTAPKSMERYAYYWVAGFTDPQEIVRVLPIEPFRIGERENGEKLWEVRSALLVNGGFIDAHLETLLETLEDHTDSIHQLSQRYDSGINCVGYFIDEHPGFHLSADILRRLCALGVSVDFDLYCYHDDA